MLFRSNASVFTGPGTNTYLIGNEEVTVLDPGPAMDSHIDAITSAKGKIKQIVVTHTTYSLKAKLEIGF